MAQVFYFTHLLYWAYVSLLLVHAPSFWKWILVPLCVFVAEKAYRTASTVAGKGKSVILEGVTMASRVTKLVIRRPSNFKHSPGDWVFLRIPAVAKYEWHPFTISSAPEDADSISVHVRGVGQWTNRVYALFESRRKRHVSARRSGRVGVATGAGGVAVNFAYDAGSESVSAVPTAGIGMDEKRLEIHLDGPFGAPASNIFRAEHAVLVATGIGVTPFSSILQSIMHRYLEAKRVCPNCGHRWCVDLGKSMMNLRKVDFFWINRDQRSFEWFVSLLDQMEQEQEEAGCSGSDPCGQQQRRQAHLLEQHQPGPASSSSAANQTSPIDKSKFLDFHLYFTSALQRTDMRAVGLQLAMDLLHKKENRDVMTKLKVRTNAGRPNWSRVFTRLRDSPDCAGAGRVTVFYCGNPHLGKVLRAKCDDFGFGFRKENF